MCGGDPPPPSDKDKAQVSPILIWRAFRSQKKLQASHKIHHSIKLTSSFVILD